MCVHNLGEGAKLVSSRNSFGWTTQQGVRVSRSGRVTWVVQKSQVMERVELRKSCRSSRVKEVLNEYYNSSKVGVSTGALRTVGADRKSNSAMATCCMIVA